MADIPQSNAVLFGVISTKKAPSTLVPHGLFSVTLMTLCMLVISQEETNWYRHLDDFPSCISQAELLQVPYTRTKYLWHNGQHGEQSRKNQIGFMAMGKLASTYYKQLLNAPQTPNNGATHHVFTKSIFKAFRSSLHLPVTTNEIKYFFTTNSMPQGVNATRIALVPKAENPSCIHDFPPIFYCNVLYKCISKILVSRLKTSLVDVIGPSQSVFLPDTESISILKACMDKFLDLSGLTINQAKSSLYLSGVDLQPAWIPTGNSSNRYGIFPSLPALHGPSARSYKFRKNAEASSYLTLAMASLRPFGMIIDYQKGNRWVFPTNLLELQPTWNFITFNPHPTREDQWLWSRHHSCDFTIQST
ncbi:hypothetical protein NC651_023441 [Populus alba x Populus x berolinensis]|nr:hypothetical protein NC651_023441 [Populus alba x Populus x berolinensis]